MTGLSRAGGDGPPAPPVRLVHLGLGAFFRAHAAWYTAHAPDADGWGIAAFAGTGLGLSETLTAQDGLYTVVTRAPGGDAFEVVGSVVEAHAASDHDAWLAHLASPAVTAVTLTVTEAGYRRGPSGRLDHDDADVRADVAALRADLTAPVTTAPGRLVAGLAARARGDGAPLALVPCDNLPGNGGVVAGVVLDMARLVSPSVAEAVEPSFTTVSTTVDRITPRTAADDIALVEAATGRLDRAPVVTEPFHEWVLAGALPDARPAWEAVGAVVTDDVGPFERRKLWLLNGAHSLLAYLGLARRHALMAEAFGDRVVRAAVEDWWSDARRHLDLPATDVDGYLDQLRARLSNRRIEHRLAQVAADGSQKLPVRVLPVVRAEREAGRAGAVGAAVLGAWVAHLRAEGAPLVDVRADELVPAARGEQPDATRAVLALLDPELADDHQVVLAVAEWADPTRLASGP